MNSAAACVSTLTLYGGRTLSSCADPLRAADEVAQADARPGPSLETVRITTRLSNSASRGRKLLPANAW